MVHLLRVSCVTVVAGDEAMADDVMAVGSADVMSVGSDDVTRVAIG